MKHLKMDKRIERIEHARFSWQVNVVERNRQQMSLRLHWIQTIHIAQANYRNYTNARKQLKQTENRRRTKRMFTRWYFAIGKKTCRIRWMFLFVRLLLRFSMAQHCKKKEEKNAKKAGKMYSKNVYMCGSARLRAESVYIYAFATPIQITCIYFIGLVDFDVFFLRLLLLPFWIVSHCFTNIYCRHASTRHWCSMTMLPGAAIHTGFFHIWTILKEATTKAACFIEQKMRIQNCEKR